ncbi:hypothetical protein BC831DRAFT_453008 [Entophlyctis helioformis]|nr:hypothetical protein BC831DRAFT_453008 [Entophlyctis helioformis]
MHVLTMGGKVPPDTFRVTIPRVEASWLQMSEPGKHETVATTAIMDALDAVFVKMQAHGSCACVEAASIYLCMRKSVLLGPTAKAALTIIELVECKPKPEPTDAAAGAAGAAGSVARPKGPRRVLKSWSAGQQSTVQLGSQGPVLMYVRGKSASTATHELTNEDGVLYVRRCIAAPVGGTAASTPTLPAADNVPVAAAAAGEAAGEAGVGIGMKRTASASAMALDIATTAATAAGGALDDGNGSAKRRKTVAQEASGGSHASLGIKLEGAQAEIGTRGDGEASRNGIGKPDVVAPSGAFATSGAAGSAGGSAGGSAREAVAAAWSDAEQYERLTHKEKEELAGTEAAANLHPQQRQTP